MVFLTFKLPPRRVRLAVLAAGAVLLAALLLFSVFRHPSTETLSAGEHNILLCLDCLDGFGWEAEPEPVSVEESILSTQLSESYLALQREAGFDLSDDMGKTVTRCTFTITNYPTGETGILADLLVRDGEVVGGDIRSTALNGFLHSLVRPSEG